MRQRWSTASAITAAGIVAIVAAFAVGVWLRRWIADDGLIYVRAARQIAAGYGPVYNVYERTEATTSTLWTYLLALDRLVLPGDLAPHAVILGGLLSVAGLALACDAARRLFRARRVTGPLVPLAAVIPVAVFPFRDYGTSGLETGLVSLWLAGAWWLLGELSATTSRRRQIAVAIVYGLGPLVRPELAIASAVFLVAGWLVVRPSRRRTLLLAALASALPLLYELFRAGYYGILVPLPALAKSAGTAEWGRGLGYVGRFVVDYALWLPLAVLAVPLAMIVARRTLVGRDRIVVATPLVCGLLLLLYVVRVGGDFMHGRMVLPPLLLLIMPALIAPITRRTAPLVAAIAIWALWIGVTVRFKPGFDWYGDWDERVTYVFDAQDPNPTTTALHLRFDPALMRYRVAHERGEQLVIWDVNGASTPIDRNLDAPVVIAAGWLGSAGAIAPLDGIAADLYGLADPIAAHLTRTQPGHVGHEKLLPWWWLLANYGDPGADGRQPFDPPNITTPEKIAAARHALGCGALAELLASVREPLTWSRFWTNLSGVVGRTRLVIPADPFEAERKFCR